MKEKPKTKIISQRQRKHLSYPQRKATCRETVEWGEKEAQCTFHLISGEGAATGGSFKICV